MPDYPVLDRAVRHAQAFLDSLDERPVAVTATLEELRAAGLVSLVLVADPLSGPPAEGLPSWFDGVCRSWKEHNLVDLTGDSEFGSPHHQRNARRLSCLAAGPKGRLFLDHRPTNPHHGDPSNHLRPADRSRGQAVQHLAAPHAHR